MRGSRSDQTHKHIRLDPARYAEPSNVCSVTIAVRGRLPVFANHSIATAAVDILQAHAARTGVAIYGFCIMPDHIHLVLAPSLSCDIVTFAGQYKNLSQRAAWQYGVKGSFWQASLWDHFLRSDEGVERTVEYVLQNPVRKGIVTLWWQYPFSGSLVFDLPRPSQR